MSHITDKDYEKIMKKCLTHHKSNNCDVLDDLLVKIYCIFNWENGILNTSTNYLYLKMMNKN